jgi:hypothetical protein
MSLHGDGWASSCERTATAKLANCAGEARRVLTRSDSPVPEGHGPAAGSSAETLHRGALPLHLLPNPGTVAADGSVSLGFGLSRHVPHRVSHVMPKQQGAHARVGAHPRGMRCAMPTVEGNRRTRQTRHGHRHRLIILCGTRTRKRGT